jgi:hypothetical protein
MTHRSRLGAALVDVPRSHYPDAVAFWRDALDRSAEAEGNDPDYTTFGEVIHGVEMSVQAVGDATPRVHLDIETDDVDAEVNRLVGLGAVELARIKSWVVMRDPVGTVFCVIRVHFTDAFNTSAASWP